MDPIDGFYQAMDSKRLLDEHGQALAAEAREVLAADPGMRVAGTITEPDSPDAPGVRAMLAQETGRVVPVGVLLVGLVRRERVEHLLRARTGTEHWLEQGWQPQTVLPVVVSTRDGHRFGFFPIGNATQRSTEM
jgi:hypothetical protein